MTLWNTEKQVGRKGVTMTIEFYFIEDIEELKAEIYRVKFVLFRQSLLSHTPTPQTQAPIHTLSRSLFLQLTQQSL